VLQTNRGQTYFAFHDLCTAVTHRFGDAPPAPTGNNRWLVAATGLRMRYIA
jgi:hypothetical protein